MSEPNWEQFRVDETFDTSGAKEDKLYAFMRSFIDWKRDKVNVPVVINLEDVTPQAPRTPAKPNIINKKKTRKRTSR